MLNKTRWAAASLAWAVASCAPPYVPGEAEPEPAGDPGKTHVVVVRGDKDLERIHHFHAMDLVAARHGPAGWSPISARFGPGGMIAVIAEKADGARRVFWSSPNGDMLMDLRVAIEANDLREVTAYEAQLIN